MTSPTSYLYPGDVDVQNQYQMVRPGEWRCNNCKKQGKARKGGFLHHLRACPQAPYARKARFRRVFDDTSAFSSSESDSGLPEQANRMEQHVQEAFPFWDGAANGSPESIQDVLEYQTSNAGITAHTDLLTESPAKHNYQDIEIEPPVGTLMPDTVHIQKHPFARTPPDVVLLHDHRVRLASIPTYWPFNTEADYDQASHFSRTGQSAANIDEQLQLLRRHNSGRSLFSYRNSKELYAILDLPHQFSHDQFRTTTINVSYCNGHYDHILYSRNLRQALESITSDPDLFDYIHLDAERVRVPHPDGTQNMRQYEEYWECDDMWQIQTSIGPESKPLIVVLYADETKMTAFGNVTLWPVYIWLGNLPASIRAAQRKGGACLIAYLPKARIPPSLPKSHHSRLRRAVYHACFRHLLESIQASSLFGDYFMFGDGKARHCTTVISMLPNDYPELCRMHQNSGLKGPSACLICFIPTDQLEDIRADWAERKRLQQTRTSLEHLTTKESDSQRKAIGLSSLENSFEIAVETHHSLARSVPFDALHMWGGGEFGRWFFKHLVKKLPESILGLLDEQFQAIPAHPGVPHYAQGISSLKWRSATDNYWISRLICPALEDALPRHESSARCILKTFRLLGECTTLIKFTTHTEVSLERLQEKLNQLHAVGQRLKVYWPDFHLNTFKCHFVHKHLVAAIRQKGPVDCTDTGFGEAQHPRSKKDYLRTSRHPGEWEPQILRRVLHRDVLADIAARKARLKAEDADPNDKGEEVGREMARVRLGKAAVGILSLPHFLRFHLPSRFPQIQPVEIYEEFQRFLYHHFPSLQAPGITKPRKHHLPNLTSFKIKQHTVAYVQYVSLLDSSLQVDRIRCTDKWRGGGPRRDYVLYTVQKAVVGYAEILSLFSIKIAGQVQSIALVDVLKQPNRDRRSGFLDARKAREGKFQFLFTDTFIRSILVHPPGSNSRRKHHTINDLIDSDMYLRLQSH